MNTNLWAPDTALSNNLAGHHLLNTMCYFTQFVSTITTHAEHLAKVFMENDVLSFGMVEILVVGDDSWLKSVFKYMCAALVIMYWPLARGNQKVMSVEKIAAFLTKCRQLQAKTEALKTIFYRIRKPISTPVIAPQLTAHIFSEVALLLVRNSVSRYT